MEHLTLYVDPAWRRPQLQHSPLLYPFWGNPLTESQPFWKQLFDRRGYDTTYYSITDDPLKADMVFMPYSHSFSLIVLPELLPLCEAEARRQGKKLLIDGLGDVEQPVISPNALVLRYGGYRFNRELNRIQIPPYADDLLELYRDGEVDIRQKGEKAVIGFAGWAALPMSLEMKTLVKELPTRLRSLINDNYRACKKGIFFRRKAIKLLRASSLVVSNFIVRSTFSANTQTMSGAPEGLRREFVENLLSSDYGLCIRGDGNASVRLFETLALGRIPIILDTECILPFSDLVDYKTFALIVDFRDLSDLAKTVANFHASLSSEEFERMQQRARDVYVRYFRVDALMPHLLQEIEKLS
ncbi:MAG: hypothetical protein JWN18_483 [Parcubacteria group bacterium]|nr:hypothetical protein [Parcubacteria group bacterium]